MKKIFENLTLFFAYLAPFLPIWLHLWRPKGGRAMIFKNKIPLTIEMLNTKISNKEPCSFQGIF